MYCECFLIFLSCLFTLCIVFYMWEENTCIHSVHIKRVLNLPIIWRWASGFWVIVRKVFPTSKIQRSSPLFSSSTYMISSFTVKSWSYLVYSVRYKSSIISTPSLTATPLFDEPSFTHSFGVLLLLYFKLC